VESVVALIRGMFGFGGPADMLASAQRAAELESDGNSPWYGAARAALGHAYYIAGDLDAAAGVLPKAAYSETAPALMRILALAVLAMTEAELGQCDRSRRAVKESMEIVESRSLGAMPEVTMAFTALGQSQAASGALEEAMATLEYGLNLRRRIPGLSPWPLIHHLLVMGRAAIMTGELPLARRLLDEVSPLLRHHQEGMGAMVARLDAAQKSLRERQAAGRATEALTAREIEVLHRLTGSSSIGEIAADLYVSPNTVKTHTTTLYRKLGARSRSEAIKIARERQLI
jgi:LuxR family maltose regulon positive regulatory protein